jgi:3-oxoacid CoA-transferase subunit A
MNFNPLAAMAGRICVLEAERIVEPGEIAPASVQLPGVHVHRVVEATVTEKRIERRTVRPRPQQAGASASAAAHSSENGN